MPLLPGEVFWYATGRFYVAEDKSIQDVGYFLHVQGISGDLFQGKRGEDTACFTFASTPFHSTDLSNGDLTVGLDTRGEFSIYLNRNPAATFKDPNSFAAGEPIATFRRRSIVAGSSLGEATGPLLMQNVFSAELVSSQEFEFVGARYDFRRLVPNGITQWGIAGPTPIPLPGYSTVLPFVGSAIAVGGGMAAQSSS